MRRWLLPLRPQIQSMRKKQLSQPVRRTKRSRSPPWSRRRTRRSARRPASDAAAEETGLAEAAAEQTGVAEPVDEMPAPATHTASNLPQRHLLQWMALTSPANRRNRWLEFC